MGFRRSYEDSAGATHAEAYYKVTEVFLNAYDMRAKIEVATFHNQAARNAGKSPFERTEMIVTTENYDAVFGTTVLDVEDMNPVKSAYGYVKDQINDPSIVDC